MPASYRIEVEVLEETPVYAHATLIAANPGHAERFSVVVDKVASRITWMSGNGVSTQDVDLTNEVLEQRNIEQIIARAFLD